MKKSRDEIKEQAEIYRLGLGFGLFTAPEVVAWCDSIIEVESAPDIGLIRASMASHKGINAVEDALAEVGGTFNKQAVLRQLFGLMFNRLKQDRSQASRTARNLFQMAMNDDVPDSAAAAQMANFRDRIDYATEHEFLGMDNDLVELTDELLRFLEQYHRRT